MGLRSLSVLRTTASRAMALLTRAFCAGVSLRTSWDASFFLKGKAEAGRADPTMRAKATAAVSFVGRFIVFKGSLAGAAAREGSPFENRDMQRMYLSVRRARPVTQI